MGSLGDVGFFLGARGLRVVVRGFVAVFVGFFAGGFLNFVDFGLNAVPLALEDLGFVLGVRGEQLGHLPLLKNGSREP